MVTAKNANFTAVFSAESPVGAGPSGLATWTITSATGAAVPCRTGNDETIRRSGMSRCQVAPQQLFASQGPYSVSVSYPGGNGLGPAATTLTQPVSPANSRTRLRLSPAAASGGLPTITALVSGQGASASPATGSVTFSVTGASGQGVPCLGGDAVPLSSGTATCTFGSALPQSGSRYTVSATYGGDGNLEPSTSRARSIRVH